MKHLRLIVALWVALAALSISGHSAPVLDGSTPALGSSATEIKKDGDLELGELYKRGTIRSVTVTNPVSVNAVVLTSANVPVIALSDGITVEGVAGASNTTATTVALDGLTATTLRDMDGNALIGGEVVAGRQFRWRYYASSSQWRIVAGSEPLTAITGMGTGVRSALAVNVGTAGAPVVNGGVLGTPSSGSAANLTGLPLTGLANQGANTILGNATAGSAAPTALAAPSCSTSSSALNYTTSTGFSCNTAINAATVTTNANLTGDVTSVGNATTIGANIVTNAKAAQMAANTVKCNNTGSLANSIDCTVAQINTLINSTVAPVFANITSKPTTLAGYGITDAEGTFTATTGVSAAGSTQGTATVLTKTSDHQIIEITTTGASQGVLLYASTASVRAVLVNRGANALSVYPTSTGTIDAGSASAPITLGVNQSMLFAGKDASNNWYTLRGASYNATAPPALGTASAGTSNDFARSDHVHPPADLSTTTQVTGILAASHHPALTGDVTTSSGAIATTISAASVSLAKMANLAANSFICNNTGSAATPIACTVAQAKTLLAIVRADITDWGTGVQTALGNATNAASGLVTKDANSNISVNSSVHGFATTVTAAGNNILTVASAEYQVYTGSTTHTNTLPVASTLTVGQQFWVINQSSGAIAVNSSGANLVQSVASGNTGIFTVVLASGTTAASWSNTYISSGAGSGTVTSVTCGPNLTGGTFTTTGTCANPLGGSMTQANLGGM